MIIIVNGILGVGKSSTARMLAERIENSVYIQGDDHSEFEGFNPHHRQHIYTVLSGIASEVNALHHKSNIIVDYIFEDQGQLDHFISSLNKNHGLTHLYIHCDEVEHIERVKRRNREDLEWELHRIIELRTVMHKSWIGNKKVVSLNTSNKPIGVVVSEIIGHLK
jgi:dephospho-CoA kinase